jgi:UDP-N-acetylmuramoyl-tripeptide--D-alanyl-D-alanine ligase
VTAALTALAVVALAVGLVRWLRVSQREHYLAGSCLRVALRWLRARPVNLAVVVAGLGATAWGWAGLPASGVAAVVGLGAFALFPYPMPAWSRAAPLKFTARAIRLTIETVVVVLIVQLGLLAGAPVEAMPITVLLLPALVDASAMFMAPFERNLARNFRVRAENKLDAVRPRVVAITGSYGKTSTKNHVRDLLAGSYTVVASPASWNNQNGLARTINEHLEPGTEFLVAEMGTYGLGEIRTMCDWLTPEIAVITAIGPMHLERMKTLDTVQRAKAEILERARVGVFNVDDERVAALAASSPMAEVWRCGSAGGMELDVSVESVGEELVVRHHDREVGRVPLAAGLHPTNLACAVAASLATGVDANALGPRLAALTLPEHRAVAATTEGGVTVIDDTFNANPPGAHAALARLVAAVPHGRRAVVTPGMVELGPEQDSANAEFARAVRASGSTLVVVGWTNRRVLTDAAREPSAHEHSAEAQDGQVVVVPSRDAAREWIRAHLTSGDGVLWENDLPDHYP